jgi:hypothetical protein
MRRLLLVVALLTCSFGAAAWLSRALAQTPSRGVENVRSQVITAADLPGWKVLGDQTSVADGVTVVTRVLVPDNNTAAVVIASIFALPSGVSTDTIVPSIMDGTFLRQVTTGFDPDSLTAFSLAGGQGIGEVDQSASYVAALNGLPLQFASVSAMRAGEVAIVVYGGDPSLTDGAVAMNYAAGIAALQDDKLRSVPGAVPSPVQAVRQMPVALRHSKP